jgi:hypothetical protein
VSAIVDPSNLEVSFSRHLTEHSGQSLLIIMEITAASGRRRQLAVGESPSIVTHIDLAWCSEADSKYLQG